MTAEFNRRASEGARGSAILGRNPDCVEWPWNRDRYGYGVQEAYGQVRAHRVAYIRAYGPIPDGLWVLHSCDNPSCINPKHLRVGTPADNAMDMKIRNRVAKGLAHPGSRITEFGLMSIRFSGISVHEARELFDVPKSVYYRIKNNESYRGTV